MNSVNKVIYYYLYVNCDSKISRLSEYKYRYPRHFSTF